MVTWSSRGLRGRWQQADTSTASHSSHHIFPGISHSASPPSSTSQQNAPQDLLQTFLVQRLHLVLWGQGTFQTVPHLHIPLDFFGTVGPVHCPFRNDLSEISLLQWHPDCPWRQKCSFGNTMSCLQGTPGLRAAETKAAAHGETRGTC